jgi:hypothetical protein
MPVLGDVFHMCYSDLCTGCYLTPSIRTKGVGMSLLPEHYAGVSVGFLGRWLSINNIFIAIHGLCLGSNMHCEYRDRIRYDRFTSVVPLRNSWLPHSV